MVQDLQDFFKIRYYTGFLNILDIARGFYNLYSRYTGIRMSSISGSEITAPKVEKITLFQTRINPQEIAQIVFGKFERSSW